MKEDNYDLYDTDINSDVSDVCPDYSPTKLPQINKTGEEDKSESLSNGFPNKEDISIKRQQDVKVYTAKCRASRKSNVGDPEESPHDQGWPTLARQCSTPEALKKLPYLIYQRSSKKQVDGKPRGSLKLNYDYNQIKSDPTIFFHVNPEMKAEILESERRHRKMKRMESSTPHQQPNFPKTLFKTICDDYSLLQKRASVLENLRKTNENFKNPSVMDKYHRIANCYKQINLHLENIIKEINSEFISKSDEKCHNDARELQKVQESRVVAKNGGGNGSDPDSGKAHQKIFIEKYLCSVAFSIDDKKHEVTSVAIDQMNRVVDNREVGALVEAKHPKMSLSSGSLADHSSLSDSNSVQSLPKVTFPLPVRHSITESSSTSSSSSLQHHQSRHSHQFTVPVLPGDKALQQRVQPRSCYCKCFCSFLKLDTHIGGSHELLSSLLEQSNSKTEIINSSKEILTVSSSKEDFSEGISSSKRIGTEEQVEVKDSKKDGKVNISKNNSYKATVESHITDESNAEEALKDNTGISKSLSVFARWLNTYYPGKVDGINEENWHEADHPLKVNFYDGSSKAMANVYMIPVTRIPNGSVIMCDVGNDMSEDGEIIKIKRFIDKNNEESFQFIVNINDDIKTFPIEKIWFTEAIKKQLGVYPRKPLVRRMGFPCPVVSGKLRSQQHIPQHIKQEMAESNLKTVKKLPTQSGENEQFTKISVITTAPPNTINEVNESEDSEKKMETRESQINFGLSELEKVHEETKVIKSSTVDLRNLTGIITRSKRTHVSSDEENGAKNVAAGHKIIKKLQTEPQPGTSSIEQTEFREKTPEMKSSEGTELSDSSWSDFYEVSDLDVECVSSIDRKTLDLNKVKSTLKTIGKEDKNLDHHLGPIRKGFIFKDHNFILTHTNRSELLANLSVIKQMVLSSSAEETEGDTATDVEEQLQNCPPFDYNRLKKQIQFGGGTVYKTIAEVNKTEYSKTITITDYPCRTPNYLLSIALGIQIYRHDLIINSCKEDSHVTKMLKYSYYMPSGWSIENARLIDRMSSKKKPLKGYFCIICLTTSTKFWHTLLTAMGAIVHSLSKDVPAFGGNVSFILADKGLNSRIYKQAVQLSIPVVTKTWIIQSLIHGEPRPYLSLAEYTYKTPPDDSV